MLHQSVKPIDYYVLLSVFSGVLFLVTLPVAVYIRTSQFINVLSCGIIIIITM